MKSVLPIIALFFVFISVSGQQAIKITDSIGKNRLLIYATNQTMKDLDILLTMEGTGFRQRAGAPRKMHIPARAKVNVLSLVIEREKKPNYSYTIETFEELSNRSLKFEILELIKINPPVPIHILIPDNCTNCDQIIADLDEGPYLYHVKKLSENEEMKNQLAPAFRGTTYDIDTIDTAIIMLGGKLFPNLLTYDEIIEKLNEVSP
ncbi:MAG TPA: hypothetical protein VKZ42_00335 [Flavobacteriaceae bacterium]|nr:hypothetical protein [Flavobacteriaceae bacterium]